MTIRKAVIPAAGLGTRFLPATKSQPKEMLPLIDKPALQYAIEEVARAGIEDVIVVTSRGKQTLEDHFDFSPELERHLEASGKTDALAGVRKVSELADVHFIRQKEPLGFGHAVLTARRHVGDDPFVVLVPDEVVPEPRGDERDLLGELVRAFDEHNASVIMVQDVPMENISAYGSISYDTLDCGHLRVHDMVEKPAPEDAPSNLGSRGRYVFSPDIFRAIDKTSAGVGGEVQLTDAIRLLASESEVFAYVHDGPIFDMGTKLNYLRATVELAMRRDDISGEFRAFIVDYVSKLH